METPVRTFGPCLELAMYQNPRRLNFIIRREVFEELGGFHEERIGLEDWIFCSGWC